MSVGAHRREDVGLLARRSSGIGLAGPELGDRASTPGLPQIRMALDPEAICHQVGPRSSSAGRRREDLIVGRASNHSIRRRAHAPR